MGIPGSKRSPLFYIEERELPEADYGKGIYIYTTEGKKFLDGCSGALAANIGHGNERVARVAGEQAGKLAFAYRTQFETRPAKELATLLAALGPDRLNRVFFINSGSEAVESCIKLARQYWWTKGQGGKSLIISRRPSYHGATIGALAATAYAPLNIPFRPLTTHMPKISAPYCYHCPLGKEYPECDMACARELKRAIAVYGKDNIAAFITEPIGGASTGGAVPPPEWFPMVAEICRENDVLLIVDDVLTGVGRTGTFYGFEHWGVIPDIVAVSKGLGGGYTPIGACVATDEIVDPILASGGFMHGHTYAGNPLSCAISHEVLNIILEDNLIENARLMGTLMHEKLHELKEKYDIIGDVRGRGLLSGIEFVRDRANREPFPASWAVAREATELARDRGLLIYPRRSLYGLSGDHVLLAPPLIINEEQVLEMINLFDETLDALNKLLIRFIQTEEQFVVAQDGTEKRYEQVEEVPAYSLGDLTGVEMDEHVNVTAKMTEGEGELKHVDLIDESEIL